VSRRCALIGVEGNHDQALLQKILCELLGFKKFDGQATKLEDPLWRKFIPVYPAKGYLYKRLDMPSILCTDTLSVAIYVGEGSNLSQNLIDKFSDIDSSQLFAFGIVADADKNVPTKVAQAYYNGFREYFSDFPNTVSETGAVIESSPRLGMYVLPNNSEPGVLDTLLCRCGDVSYPQYMERAREYIDKFSEQEIKHWKNFDKDKAIVATVASVLKPGKTNTVSITDDKWINSQTKSQITELQNLTNFLRKLLDLSE
jgi:hypothetical protein